MFLYALTYKVQEGLADLQDVEVHDVECGDPGNVWTIKSECEAKDG